MKKFFFILSIVADGYTAWQGINYIVGKVHTQPPFWLIALLLCLFILCTLYILFYLMISALKRKCVKHGTHEIPCSLYSFFFAHVINMTKSSLHAMHYIYHSQYAARDNMRNTKCKSIRGKEVRTIINKFLGDAQFALNYSLHIKVRLSLKLQTLKGKDAVLETYTYVVDKKDSLDRIENLYYKVSVENAKIYDTMNQWCNDAKRYAEKNGNSKYASNSIFNYLIGVNKPYWFSNDLQKEEENGEFFSSSQNRSKYKSLAVFLVREPDANNSKKTTKGLITFDSDKTSIFVEKECIQIMGFIAHCMYEILKEFENGKQEKEDLMSKKATNRNVEASARKAN